MTYLETVNHPSFREANNLVHQAEELLKQMGMNQEQRFAWFVAWVCGAGDGSQ